MRCCWWWTFSFQFGFFLIWNAHYSWSNQFLMDGIKHCPFSHWICSLLWNMSCWEIEMGCECWFFWLEDHLHVFSSLYYLLISLWRAQSSLIHSGPFVIQLHCSDLLAEPLKMYNGYFEFISVQSSPWRSKQWWHHWGLLCRCWVFPFPSGSLKKGYALFS